MESYYEGRNSFIYPADDAWRCQGVVDFMIAST
jgi:hypothetical protein